MRLYLACLLYIISLNVFACIHGCGVVTMNGQLQESACSISMDDVWQEVNFGNVVIKDVNIGESLSKKKFSIQLVNCELNKKNGDEWKVLQIAFDGQTDSGADSFRMPGRGKGASLQISDGAGNRAVAGVPMEKLPLTEGTTDINLELSLIRNKEHLTAGDISAFLRFMIIYQ